MYKGFEDGNLQQAWSKQKHIAGESSHFSFFIDQPMDYCRTQL